MVIAVLVGAGNVTEVGHDDRETNMTIIKVIQAKKSSSIALRLLKKFSEATTSRAVVVLMVEKVPPASFSTHSFWLRF